MYNNCCCCFRGVLIDLSGTLHTEAATQARSLPAPYAKSFDGSGLTSPRSSAQGSLDEHGRENRGLKRPILRPIVATLISDVASAISGRTSSYPTLQRKSAIRNRLTRRLRFRGRRLVSAPFPPRYPYHCLSYPQTRSAIRRAWITTPFDRDTQGKIYLQLF